METGQPTAENPDVMLPWSTPSIPADNRHNVRVLCDLAGLSLVPTIPVLINGVEKLFTPKDILCACIELESGFYNYKPDGTPTVHRNLNKFGTLTSTDWGICQINDTPGWYIGEGLPFSSVEYLLANPQAAVSFMIAMFKEGQLSKWVSYTSGEFKRYLPA